MNAERNDQPGLGPDGRGAWRPSPPRYVPPPPPPIEPPPLVSRAEAAAARRKGLAGRVTLILLVAGLAALVVLGISQARTSAVTAGVGDCLTGGADATDITKVDCGAPEAGYTVVGKLEDKSELDAQLSACDEFADATRVYWEGKRRVTSVGTVLCMKEIPK